jgi:hypothetical protein
MEDDSPAVALFQASLDEKESNDLESLESPEQVQDKADEVGLQTARAEAAADGDRRHSATRLDARRWTDQCHVAGP